MAEHIRNPREVPSADDNMTDEPEPVHETDTRITHADNQSLAARAVWYVAGILLAILALRFLPALLGANPANAFANFIYTLSYPFVAPFFSLFSYNLRYGVARVETYTLVAMVVYALVAWAIARLITLNRPAPSTY